MGEPGKASPHRQLPLRAYNQKGVVFQQLGRYEEALAAFEQTIRLDPTYIRAYNNKGDVLHQLGRYQEGDDAYEQYTLVFIDAYENNCPLNF